MGASQTALRGALFGAWIGYSSGERLLLHARLGAGGLFGAVAGSAQICPERVHIKAGRQEDH
ncbi:hypothetical protein BE18_50645 [Sorangium cellulosum]|uniref:Uncharacterized protein n=1 Tax=Sorangium cellulosum TaxID=56 RepID=A0A150T1C6_SORCE|nr:hypothetical protein BE18_50645 [Sorangium cellulosum]